MKLDRSVKYGIGSLITDVLLIIEVAIDIYTGNTTWLNLWAIIVLSLILGIIIYRLLKKTVGGRRTQKDSAKAEVREKAMNTEVSEINSQDNASTDPQS